MKVMTDDKYTKAQSGLIYLDLVQGNGEPPKDGQQVLCAYYLTFLLHELPGSDMQYLMRCRS